MVKKKNQKEYSNFKPTNVDHNTSFTKTGTNTTRTVKFVHTTEEDEGNLTLKFQVSGKPDKVHNFLEDIGYVDEMSTLKLNIVKGVRQTQIVVPGKKADDKKKTGPADSEDSNEDTFDKEGELDSFSAEDEPVLGKDKNPL